ncbi:hypothetical protein ACOSQ4_029915 [Xanthoceras sorbifolium]
MIRGLRLAEELLLLHAGLDSESLFVVNLISSSLIPASELGLLILDILKLLHYPSFVGVNFIPKSANFIAHDLASLAFSFSIKQVWIDHCLSIVERRILDEFPVVL